MNIVERLRTYPYCDTEGALLQSEAADEIERIRKERDEINERSVRRAQRMQLEIERLRSALEDIIAANISGTLAKSIARKALK